MFEDVFLRGGLKKGGGGTWTLRGFFFFFIYKRHSMSNRKMNTCLGCRIVRVVYGIFQACYQSSYCNVSEQ